MEGVGVMVIETLWRVDPVLRESKWIKTLETTCPTGVNLRSDSL